MDMIEEFESKIGVIAEGWPVYDSREKLLFQIVRTNHLTHGTMSIYSTLGLSNYTLKNRNKPEENFRIELTICLSDESKQDWVPELLRWFGENAIKSGNCPLRGDLYSLSGSNIYVDGFVSLYVTLPLYLDDDKWILYRHDGSKVMMAWVIPLKDIEDQYCIKNGWTKLEDVMEDNLQSLIYVPRAAMF